MAGVVILQAKPSPCAPNAPHKFASLKSGEVNVRTGPGYQYPIQWTLVRKDLPVRILATFDNWQKIEDVEGKVGWVYKNLLNSNLKQMVIVTALKADVKKKPTDEALAIAYLEKGVIAALLETQGSWCYLVVNKSVKGWVKSCDVWGVPQ